MREHSARTGHRGGEFLPLARGGIAFDKFACRPIAIASGGEQKLVDVDLAAAGNDIAGALRDDGTALVVVGLVQESASRVDGAPQVERGPRPNFAHARDQCFRIDGLRHVVAPCHRVERAQQVWHEGRACTLAGIARSTGELAEHGTTGMADYVRILELRQVVFVVLVCRAIATGLRRGVRHAHGTHFDPRVFASVGIAGNHGIRHVMANFHRCPYRAAEGGAKEPVADPDDPVFEAIGDSAEAVMVAVLSAKADDAVPIMRAAIAARRRRGCFMAVPSDIPRYAQPPWLHPVRHR